MKTIDVIECAKLSVKNCAKSLRSANKEYTSLSQVLKDIQRRALMESGYRDVFAALGLRADGKFTPAEFFACMQDEQFLEVEVSEGRGKNRVTHTERRLGIWSMRQVLNEDGEKMWEEDGVTPILEPHLSEVHSWTPTRLFKCIAQANAFAAKQA